MEWIKTKSENEDMSNKFGYFLESVFVGVNRLFVLVSTNVGDKVIIIAKSFYDQATNSEN